MGRSQRNQKKKKGRTWLKVLGSIIGVLVLLVGGYGFYIYKNLTEAVSTMHEERKQSDLRETDVNVKKNDPISFLLMGVDERSGDRGRADSLIVVTVNPNTNSMNMMSIPRDTRVDIVGKGIMDKINHSYAFGGTDMTLATVEKFLDIPLDYYVKVNMESFKEIIDSLGGVQVNNETIAFEYEGYSFAKGINNLDGDAALAFARMRKQDSDFGRQDRQREVISAIIDKGSNPSILLKMDDILGTLGDNVKTNMTFDEMKTVQANYASARANNSQFMIQGSGQTIDGVYYYVVPEEERLAVSARLKESLEIN